MPKREIELTRIRWDATDLQAREGDMDAATIAHYADRMNEGEADNFPPIILFHDGTDYWPADGWYRGRAAEKAGFGSVAADVRDGTREDAWEYAHTEANARHGRPLTNHDKRKKVAAYIRRHLDYSDNRIAEKCHVPYGMVVKVRASLPDQVRAREPETRTGADGKQYPAKRKKPDTVPSQDVGESAEVPTIQTDPVTRQSVIRDTVPVREDKPKRPAPFVDRFDDLCGELIRFVQSFADHRGQNESRLHRRFQDQFGMAMKTYKEWRDAA